MTGEYLGDPEQGFADTRALYYEPTDTEWPPHVGVPTTVKPEDGPWIAALKPAGSAQELVEPSAPPAEDRLRLAAATRAALTLAGVAGASMNPADVRFLMDPPHTQ